MDYEQILSELKKLSDYEKFKAISFLLNKVDFENTSWQYQGVYDVKSSICKLLDNVENRDFYINLENSFESAIEPNSNIRLFGESKFRRQNGAEQYGHIKLELTSFSGESDFLLKWQVDEQIIPLSFCMGVIEGIKNWGEKNRIKGLLIKVIGGSYHEIDSREMSFRIATLQALDDAFKDYNKVMNL